MAKKNKGLLIMVCILVVVFGGFFYFLHMPSQQYRQKMTLGQRFLTEKSYQKAEAAFADAIRISPKKKDAYEGIVVTYLTQAEENAKTRPKQAEKYYEQAADYAKQAESAGAGTIKLTDYSTYTPEDEDEKDNSDETVESESTESFANDQKKAEKNGAIPDYVTLGQKAIEDAKSKYESNNGLIPSDGSASVQYALYDFNGDGIRDIAILIKDSGTSSMYFYTVDHKEARNVLQDTVVVNIDALYGFQNGFVYVQHYDTTYNIFTYTWNGTQMDKANIYSGPVNEAYDNSKLDKWAAFEKIKENTSDEKQNGLTRPCTTLNWRDESNQDLLKRAARERTDIDYEQVYKDYIEDGMQKAIEACNQGLDSERYTRYGDWEYTLLDVNQDGILDLIDECVMGKRELYYCVYSYNGTAVNYLGMAQTDLAHASEIGAYQDGFAFVLDYGADYTVYLEKCSSGSLQEEIIKQEPVQEGVTYSLEGVGYTDCVLPSCWCDHQSMALLQKPFCPYAAEESGMFSADSEPYVPYSQQHEE